MGMGVEMERGRRGRVGGIEYADESDGWGENCAALRGGS